MIAIIILMVLNHCKHRQLTRVTYNVLQSGVGANTHAHGYEYHAQAAQLSAKGEKTGAEHRCTSGALKMLPDIFGSDCCTQPAQTMSRKLKVTITP